MIRRLVRQAGATLILFALATALRAETYQDWVKVVPNPRPIPFQGWLSPSTVGSAINKTEYSVFQSPLGHLFGYIDLSSYPPADFPLRVRALYYRVGESARNQEGNGFNPHLPDWTSPLNYVAPNASLGELLESRESEIATAAESRALPLWSVWSQTSRGPYEGGLNPYSVLVEVASHDGTLLARRRMVEAVAGGTTRNVFLARSNSDADQGTKGLGDLTTADFLPMEAAVYDDVKVLWLDPETLHNAGYTDSFWHNVFFAGTMVVGRDAEVQELAQRLGLSPNQRVLQGGLWTAARASDILADNSHTPHNLMQFFAPNPESPFQQSSGLGQSRTRALRSFSIWFLVSFTVFEIAIIVGSLFLLQGGRRVFRWMLIPVSAILYTMAGLFVVRLVVDFRPEARIAREVESVEGWPESAVRADIMRLGFDDHRASFTAPAQAAFSWSAIDSDTSPLISVPGENLTTFSLRQRYGRFASAQIQYQQPAASPCQVTADGQITATRPLRVAWIWDGKIWRNVGPMEPGKPIALDGGNHPHQVSTSYQNDGSFPETVRAFISPNVTNSLKGTNVGLLLAVEDGAGPEQMTDAATSEVHTQTILVHQFQLPAAKP